MPKVLVTGAKGLYQESGTGFELGDVAIKPAIETLAFGRLSMTVAAQTSADEYDGLYFDLSDSSGNDYRFWFDVNNASTAPDSGGRQLVEMDIASGTVAHIDVAAIINTKTEEKDFVCEVHTAGELDIYCKTLGMMNSAADTTGLGTTVSAVTTARGSGGDGTNGSNDPSLSKKVTVFEMSAQTSGATQLTPVQVGTTFTLADGSYAGQEKIIIRNDAVDVAWVMVVTSGCDEDGGTVTVDGSDNAYTFPANTSSALGSVLHLIWDGNKWVRTSGVGGHAGGGVTGLNA